MNNLARRTETSQSCARCCNILPFLFIPFVGFHTIDSVSGFLGLVQASSPLTNIGGRGVFYISFFVLLGMAISFFPFGLRCCIDLFGG